MSKIKQLSNADREKITGLRGVLTNNSKNERFFLKAENLAQLTALMEEKDFEYLCEDILTYDPYLSYLYLEVDYQNETFKRYEMPLLPELLEPESERIVSLALGNPLIKSKSRTSAWFIALFQASFGLCDLQLMSVFQLNKEQLSFLKHSLAEYAIATGQIEY